MLRAEVSSAMDRPLPPRQGLVDGGHIILKCSGCDHPLVDIFIVKPDAVDHEGKPFEWCAIAHCSCGDRSYEKSWRGQFKQGPAAIDNPNDTEDAKLLTRIINIGNDKNAEGKNRIVFYTRKEPQ